MRTDRLFWRIGFTAMLHLARVSNNCIDEKAHQVYALAFDPLRPPIADGAVAPVVELADTQDSGSCAGDGVEVRILSGAHQSSFACGQRGELQLGRAPCAQACARGG